MKVLAAVLLALLAFGCAQKTEPATTSSSQTTDTAPVSHETVDAVHEKGAAAKSTTE